MCIHERFQISIQNILDKYTSLNVGTCPSYSDWNVKILAWQAGVQFMTGYDGNGLSCSDTHHHLQTSWYEEDLVLNKIDNWEIIHCFLVSKLICDYCKVWFFPWECSIFRLNSVKNTNFRLDNKKLFLMHWKIVF